MLATLLASTMNSRPKQTVTFTSGQNAKQLPAKRSGYASRPNGKLKRAREDKEAQGISQIRPHGQGVSPAGPEEPGTIGKTGALPLEAAELTGVHGLCKKTHEPNHSQRKIASIL